LKIKKEPDEQTGNYKLIGIKPLPPIKIFQESKFNQS
jgi:hypothetical protein